MNKNSTYKEMKVSDTKYSSKGMQMSKASIVDSVRNSKMLSGEA